MIELMNYAGVLGVDTQATTQTEVREAARTWLVETVGYDEWDADDAAGRCVIERAWWADAPPQFGQAGIAGFHGIVVVNGLGVQAQSHLAVAWSASDGEGAISA